jgi:hypothetical protein
LPLDISNAQPFIPGSFEYISDKSTRLMLQNAYQAISMTEKWDFFMNNFESFSFNPSPEIKIISKKMKELGYDNHTGSTFGWTMRQMEFIKKEGEKKFRDEWMKYEEN